MKKIWLKGNTLITYDKFKVGNRRYYHKVRITGIDKNGKKRIFEVKGKLTEKTERECCK